MSLSERKIGLLAKIILAVLPAFLLGNFFYAKYVIQEAERIAGNAPYCLEVSNEGDYKSATSAFDLTPLIMHAGGEFGHVGTWHSVMVIAEPFQHLHWSYWHLGFDESRHFRSNSLEYFPIKCVPKAHFAKLLGWFKSPPEPSKSSLVMINKQKFRVPAEYFPLIKSDTANIEFYAVKPDFHAPPSKPFSFNYDYDRSYGVIIHLDNGERVQLGNNPTTYKIQKLEPKFGLDKRIVFEGNDRAVPQYRLLEGGRLKTFIDCGWSLSEPRVCQHHFVYGNWSIEFYQSETDVRNWQSLESAMIARIESLKVH